MTSLEDVPRQPFKDGSFDLVVSGLALAHQPDLAPVLAGFARVLRPGGHVVLSDIHWIALYLGGALAVKDSAGRARAVPTSRFRASGYISASLQAGLVVRDCHEPTWGPHDSHGGPSAQHWCPDPATAAYEGTPAAIICHFQRPYA